MDSPSLFQEDASQVDDAFAESMGFVTTTSCQKFTPLIKKLIRRLSSKRQLHSRPEDFIAFRTRYAHEVLNHRNPQILQIVILGAGLDARAYRLESLRGCHVFEVDQAKDMFDHKTEVVKELNATLITQKVDYVVSDLAQNGLENCLMVKGFNPVVPTFWAMEGLFPYIERLEIVELLKVVDHLSAPGSEIWVGIPGQIVADGEEWGKRAMKYREDDPIHGVLSDILWELEVQVSLGVAAEHFGRQWMPMLSPKTKQEVPFFYVIGKKPISA